MLNHGLYTMHLLSCAFTGERPAPLPADVTWDRVYSLAASNSVEGAAWRGAMPLADEMPEELRTVWAADAESTLYRRVNFDVEREAVLALLESAGLSYLPLKGILMADYYPYPDMRSMADNDILYGFVEPLPASERDAVEVPAGLSPEAVRGFRVQGMTSAAREQTIRRATQVVTPLMEARGYYPESLEAGSHDSFHKQPLFNFELHRNLMSYKRLVETAYYDNPWKRAIQDPANPLRFSFTHEDEYVFHIAHAFKHYAQAGCGVRCVADQWAFMRTLGDSLDWDYIERQVNQLGIASFEADLRAMAKTAFSGEEGATSFESYAARFTSEQKDMLVYMLGSGTYGTIEHTVENKLEEFASQGASGFGATVRYALDRAFPPAETVMDNHAFFRRHPRLLFLAPVYRLGIGLTSKRGKLFTELRLLSNQKKKD